MVTHISHPFVSRREGPVGSDQPSSVVVIVRSFTVLKAVVSFVGGVLIWESVTVDLFSLHPACYCNHMPFPTRMLLL